MSRKRKAKSAPAVAPLAAEQAAKAALKRVEVVFPPVRVWQPDGSVLIKPGKAVVLNGADEITTAEAGKILGCSADWISRRCDRVDLIEGRDWRRVGTRGNYRIKRASILKLSELAS